MIDQQLRRSWGKSPWMEVHYFLYFYMLYTDTHTHAHTCTHRTHAPTHAPLSTPRERRACGGPGIPGAPLHLLHPPPTLAHPPGFRVTTNMLRKAVGFAVAQGQAIHRIWGSPGLRRILGAIVGSALSHPHGPE